MKLPIDIWYGRRQHFGSKGLPQRWINILGRVDVGIVRNLAYSLNGCPWQKLSLGPDGHRLAFEGDFNIELDNKNLLNGENELILQAGCADGGIYQEKVCVVFERNSNPPKNIDIDWNKAEKISDFVQVVDGRWELTPQGLRITEPYYDRAIGIGDISWSDYEVTAEVVFYGLREPDASAGDAGANVIHAAIALRWLGHDDDLRQPRVKWYPLGATAEFRVNPSWENCSWRILGGSNICVESDLSCDIQLGRKYILNHRVESLSGGAAKYSAKIWPADNAAPKNYQVILTKQQGPVKGGILLLAHYTQLSFGRIQVRSLE